MPAFLPFGIMFYRVEDQGWAEVYPLLSTDYATAVADLDTINTARLALANVDCTVTGVRVSDTSVRGDSYPVALATQAGTFGGTPDTSAPCYETYKVKLWAGATNRSHRFLRAVPSELMIGGVINRNIAYNTALDAWEVLLRSKVAIASKIKDAVAAPFYTFHAITNTQDVGQAKRNVGRPFDLPVGRRLIA